MVCDVIFIQRAVRFGEGIENTQRVRYKLYHITKYGRFFLSHLPPYTCFLVTLLFKWRGVGIHNVISKYYDISDITLIIRESM
jgi:hypothetical protein